MNPLLSDWTSPFQIASFDQIKDAHFAPAFDEALKQARADIHAVADNSDAPSFANTIEALEQSIGQGAGGVLLGRRSRQQPRAPETPARILTQTGRLQF